MSKLAFRFIVTAGSSLLAACAGLVAPEQTTGGRAKAFLSIDHLTQREYVSSLSVAEKLGDFPGYSSYAVEFDSDGLLLRALMNIPATPMPASGYPVLIMNHGNAGTDWDRFRRYYSRHQDSDEYRALAARTPFLRYAREGFVVLLPDYRGHGDSETNGKIEGGWQLDRHGNRAVNRAGEFVPRVLDNDGLRFNGWLYTAYYTIDVLNLIAALSDIAQPPAGLSLDLANLFIWGRSLGADVTARVLTCSDEVNAVSLWVPATTSLWDQAHYYHYDAPGYADGISMENLIVELQTYNEVYETRLVTRDLLPNNYIDQVDGAVLIQISSDDTGVRPAWGIEYHFELQEYGLPTELRIYPGSAHVFDGEILEQAIQADLAFFRGRMR